MDTITSDPTALDRLSQHESEMRHVLNCVGHLLSELVDSEADAGCRIPDVPAGEPSEGITGLLFRLRRQLARADMLCDAKGFRGCGEEAVDDMEDLQERRNALLMMLDDLVELAISTSRVSSWSDIEVRFLHFSLSLSGHLANEGDAWKRWLRNLGASVDFPHQHRL